MTGRHKTRLDKLERKSNGKIFTVKTKDIRDLFTSEKEINIDLNGVSCYTLYRLSPEDAEKFRAEIAQRFPDVEPENSIDWNLPRFYATAHEYGQSCRVPRGTARAKIVFEGYGEATLCLTTYLTPEDRKHIESELREFFPF